MGVGGDIRGGFIRATTIQVDYFTAYQTININATVEASALGTGAIIIPTGGLSVRANAQLGGNVIIHSSIDSSTTVTGALQVRGGVGIGGNINVGGNVVVYSSSESINSTTGGALQVKGGVGIEKQLAVGGQLTALSGVITTTLVVNSEVTINSSTVSENTTAGALFVKGGIALGGSINAGGILVAHSNIESLSATTGALQVKGGAGIKGNTNIGGNVIIYSSIDSSSTVTGALQVRGGVGIGGNTNIGGNTIVYISTESISTATGALQIRGGVGIGGNTNIGGNVIIYSTTESNSTVTGALQVRGGLGVGGDIRGGVIRATSIYTDEFISYQTININGTEEASYLGGGALKIQTGGLSVWKNTLIGGNVIIYSSIDSSSTVTGALQIRGGVGIGGNTNIGGNVIIHSSFQSSSSTTGALRVKGGVGIERNLYVGETLNVTNNATVGGTLNVNGSLYVGPDDGALNTPRSIFFGGVSSDWGYMNSVIENRIYGGVSDQSELLLYKGNDPSNDRIRLKAGSIRFDTDTGTASDRITENTRMIILSTGNVGIGTLTPSTLFHVNGAITCTTIQTNSNQITCGPIVCTTIGTAGSQITCGTVSCTNIAASAGISCTTIQTNSNQITCGPIVCTTIGTAGSQITCGTVSCTNIAASAGISCTTIQTNSNQITCGPIVCTTIGTAGSQITCGTVSCTNIAASAGLTVGAYGDYTTKTISFGGSSGDLENWMTTIDSRNFSTSGTDTDVNELFIYKGNDPSNDRIRLKSGEIRFDIITGGWEEPGGKYNNNNKMIILSSGNVGIGTVTPSTLFHVNGAITCTTIQTNSNQITCGPIVCTTIGTAGSQITCGTVSCTNIAASAGISCTTIQTNSNQITCGPIVCTTINTNSNQITCGPISCTNIVASAGITCTTVGASAGITCTTVGASAGISCTTLTTSSSATLGGTLRVIGASTFQNLSSVYQTIACGAINTSGLLTVSTGGASITGGLTVASGGITATSQTIACGAITTSGLLTVSTGGASITGGLTVASGGITATSQTVSCSQVTIGGNSLYLNGTSLLINHPITFMMGTQFRVGWDALGPTVVPSTFHGTVTINSGFLLTAGGGISATGQTITAGTFNAGSDRRIKTNITDISGSSLDILRKIKPREYIMIDTKKPRYGFIAQEVKQHIPRSVELTTTFIPSVYENAFVKGNTITLINKSTTDISNCKLKLRGISNNDIIVNITHIQDDKTFTINEDISQNKLQDMDICGNKLDKHINNGKVVYKRGSDIYSGEVKQGVFVYGIEVDDFHSINHDAIWTVAVGATQEMDVQLQEARQTIKSLEERISAIERHLLGEP